MSDRISQIMEKPIGSVTVEDLSYLASQIRNLEYQKQAARAATTNTTCLLITADKHEIEFDLRNVGYTAPPTSFYLTALKSVPVSFSFSAGCFPDPVEAVYFKREYRLDRFRSWDGIPIYKEVV